MGHYPTTLITLILGVAALLIGLVLARQMRRRSDRQVQEMHALSRKSHELLQSLLDAQQETNRLLHEIADNIK